MLNLKFSIKLSYKLIIATLIAFIVSTLLFLILQSISTKVIYSYFSNPEFRLHQEQKKISELQRYIFDNRLSIFDYPKINGWSKEKDLTMISLYYNNRLIYDSKTHYYASNLDAGIEIGNLPLQNFYSVYFFDKKAKVIILDHFEHRYKHYASYINLCLFFLSFINIMILFIKKKIAYIDILSKEVKLLEDGHLNHEITIIGNDELALLAYGLDEMRKAFIIRQNYSHQVKAASNELMASISHDLRTPLTTLIGYLDIASAENFKNEHTQYLKKSKDRAYQLKYLIDNLFQYFFVSTTSNDPVVFSICSGIVELDMIIQENVFFLEQNGFLIHNKTTNDRYSIEIHLNLLQRLFDNLFSNIIKYADPCIPVKIINYIDDGCMVIEFRNKILENPQSFESTGLGLKTCEKIMEQHKGRFIAKKQNNEFISKIFFPIL